MAAATSFERQDKAKTLSEPLEPEHLGLLLEVAGLHGAFILGFPQGAALSNRADLARQDLDLIEAIGQPTSSILAQLSRQHRIVTERARQLIEALDAALTPGAWKVARIGYTSYAAVRNALIAFGRIAVWANEKGGLAGGAILAATETSIPPETLQAMGTFLISNAPQILAFAAPFPELHTYIQWTIRFFDAERPDTLSEKRRHSD
jgi:hypothetical protein